MYESTEKLLSHPLPLASCMSRTRRMSSLSQQKSMLSFGTYDSSFSPQVWITAVSFSTDGINDGFEAIFMCRRCGATCIAMLPFSAASFARLNSRLTAAHMGACSQLW